MATIETGETVKGVERGWDDGRVALGASKKIGEICTSRAGREVDDGAQAAKPGAAFTFIEVGPEGTPGVTGGDHQPNSQIGMPASLYGFQ